MDYLVDAKALAGRCPEPPSRQAMITAEPVELETLLRRQAGVLLDGSGGLDGVEHGRQDTYDKLVAAARFVAELDRSETRVSVQSEKQVRSIVSADLPMTEKVGIWGEARSRTEAEPPFTSYTLGWAPDTSV